MSSEPLPLIVTPTYSWDGDDGSWSTFAIEVGSPPQSFRVLPATIGQEVAIPVPQGCGGALSNLTDCGNLRGANDNASRGFLSEKSTTWDPQGPYVFSDGNNLFGDANPGLYGLDSVALANKVTGNYTSALEKQTVAGISQQYFWLGILGLGTSLGKLSSDTAIPSLMATLKNQTVIPSLSYGYTAGQSYGEYPRKDHVV